MNKIKNIEGLKNYMIGYYPDRSNEKNHYSKAELIYKGYEIKLPSVYYMTLDEAVQGLKDRIIQAAKEFDITIEKL